jgi:hypothetical protein
MKLYFDIESNDNNINNFSQINFIDELTTVLLKIFKIHFNIQLLLESDFIWMESNGHDINGRINKYSYHLVIKNYKILNHEQLQFIINNLIRNEVSEHNSQFIDWRVYSKNHLLRTLTSIKAGDSGKKWNKFTEKFDVTVSDRIFRHMNPWNYNYNNIYYKCKEIGNIDMFLFRNLLIIYTDGCKYILVQVLVKINNINNNVQIFHNLSDNNRN